MTRKTAILLICAALAAGCNRSQTAKRGDQNYQVVEEGQASGVTSTINAPGEAPPLMTDTAIDTTTNFTLPDNPAPLGTLPPNTVAGTLPAYTPYPPATTSRPRPVTPPPPMSSGAPPPPQPKPEPPPPTDTAVTDEVLPPTETTGSQPPPPAKDEQKEEGEQTDTAKTDTSSTTTTTNPPPPTPPV